MRPLRSALIAASTIAVSNLSVVALDLTPIPGFRELEGLQIPVVYFEDGAQRVTYRPPAHWTPSGGKMALNFFAPDWPEALMQFRIVTRAPRTNPPEDLEKWCRGLLPKDAIDPGVTPDSTNPFTLRAVPAQEYSYSYASSGRRFTTAVAVADFNERERFALIVTARAADFKAVHDAAIRSMFSFNWRK